MWFSQSWQATFFFFNFALFHKKAGNAIHWFLFISTMCYILLSVTMAMYTIHCHCHTLYSLRHAYCIALRIVYYAMSSSTAVTLLGCDHQTRTWANTDNTIALGSDHRVELDPCPADTLFASFYTHDHILTAITLKLWSKTCQKMV